MTDIAPAGSGNWSLTNDLLKVEVSAERGGDIRSIVLRPSGTEILWRDEFIGAPPEGDDGEPGFFDSYRGGIQELFPNAGPRTNVEGASLPFHGEACRATWHAEVEDGDVPALQLSVDLRRYPFRLTRHISLLSDRVGVTVRSTVTNLSSRALPVHWGLHPVFAEEITQGGELYGGFAAGVSESTAFGLSQSYAPGQPLPVVSDDGVGRLTLVDGNAGTSDLGYLGAKEGWFVVAGESGCAVAMVWPVDVLPEIWLWQECRGQTNYPWWGRHHVVGVEPHTTAPILPLEEEMLAGTAPIVGARESMSVEYMILATASGTAEFVHDVRALARSITPGGRS